jgi:hypothetical protein
MICLTRKKWDWTWWMTIQDKTLSVDCRKFSNQRKTTMTCFSIKIIKTSREWIEKRKIRANQFMLGRNKRPRIKNSLIIGKWKNSCLFCQIVEVKAWAQSNFQHPMIKRQIRGWIWLTSKSKKHQRHLQIRNQMRIHIFNTPNHQMRPRLMSSKRQQIVLQARMNNSLIMLL